MRPEIASKPEFERMELALASIANGLPKLDEWDSAADFMESCAEILDVFGFTHLRPDHYEEW